MNSAQIPIPTKISLVKWMLRKLRKKTKGNVRTDIPLDYRFPKESLIIHPDYPTARWMGHSTFLLDINGINILTDPVWSERCSPFQGFGPKRTHEMPCAIADLPRIDYVLISHNHFDHLDSATVKALNKRFPDIVWIVPVGVRRFLEKRGVAQIIQLKWWQDIQLENGLKVTATPSQHWSGRGLFDVNKSLWCGFVIEGSRKNEQRCSCYFAGDTGYNERDFKQIGGHFGGVDLALLPIGAYEPNILLKSCHVNPSEAVKIHLDVGSKLSLSMHWKTFPTLTDEHPEQPPYELQQALLEAEVPHAHFRVLDPGERINW